MRRLAKITKASLEIKDRGILNFWVHVNYEEGTSQGIGGISLDQYDKDKKTRVGTAYGCEMIRQLLLVLRVNDFSEMKGQYIWVIGDGEGFSFNPTGIQALNVDEPDIKQVIFSEIAAEFS